MVTTPTPAWAQASSTRRRLLVPARWPNRRGWPRRLAQRPLPSMMKATCRGTRPAGRAGGGKARGLAAMSKQAYRRPPMPRQVLCGIKDFWVRPHGSDAFDCQTAAPLLCPGTPSVILSAAKDLVGGHRWWSWEQILHFVQDDKARRLPPTEINRPRPPPRPLLRG